MHKIQARGSALAALAASASPPSPSRIRKVTWTVIQKHVQTVVRLDIICYYAFIIIDYKMHAWIKNKPNSASDGMKNKSPSSPLSHFHLYQTAWPTS